MPLLFTKKKKTVCRNPIAGPRSNATLSNMPDRLSKLSGAIHVSCQNRESKFLELGEKLQEINGLAMALSKNVLAAAKQIAHLSNKDIFKHLDHHLFDSINQFTVFRDDVQMDLDSIHTIADSLGELSILRQQIKGIGRHLYPIALNMIIENSVYGGANAKFDSIGNEIKILSHKVDKFSSEIRNTADHARNNIMSTCHQTEDDLLHLAKLVDESRKNIQASIDKSRQLLSFSQSLLEQADHRTESIAKQIGEVVMGIQLHDSIRQRIDHIGKSLHDAELLHVESNTLPVSDPQTDKKLGQICLIIKLQAAQLRQIKIDVDAAHQSTFDAFEKIAGEISELASGLVIIGGITKKKAEDPLTDLNRILLSLQQHLKNGDELIQRLTNIPEEILTTTTALSTLMSQIKMLSQDTQNKALNAMVSTMRLGEKGKTLNILAQEMKELSIELKDIVSNVLGFIESISARAHDMEHKYDKYKTETAAYDTISPVIGEISQINNQFNTHTADIVAHTDTLREKISQTKEDIFFFRKFSSELNQHVNEIDALYTLMAPWENPEADTSILNKYMDKRYTMQKERDVGKKITHSSSVYAEDNPIDVPDDPCPDANRNEDLGNNIELF